MSKHTQGPWKAVRYYDDELTVTDSMGFEHVSAASVAILFDYQEKLGINHWADSPDASRDISDEEQNANARLIAAAPDLLEALVQLEDVFCSVGPCMTREDREDSRAALIAARAAIAKARGDA